MVYLLVFVIFTVYFVFCNLLNDPYKLNIDRWQTLNYSLDFWIHGQYFYDEINFMGNKSSYLPGQLLVSLPFYLLKNVGYLQLASFLLFAYTLKLSFKSNYLQFLGIFMFGISLSYIYEVLCKSDFLSSFILVASFIAIWDKKFKDNYFKKPYLLGGIVGVLCLTRSVALLPLIIFLFRPFLFIDFHYKIKFVAALIFTIIVLLGTVILPADDLFYVLKHNPLNLQGQSNSYVMMFFLLTAFWVSFKVRRVEHVFYFSSIFLFLLMVCFLTEKYFLLNYHYQSNLFSTTYLAACLPFAIISFCFTIQKEMQQKDQVKNLI
ncbi:MAG: hypothetical protein KA796_07280 [Chryseobacterium sp.]|nr:hypothetical protein [Chryseobacterium sp.]